MVASTFFESTLALEENSLEAELAELERRIRVLKKSRHVMFSNIIIVVGLSSFALYSTCSDRFRGNTQQSQLWPVMCYAGLVIAASGLGLKSCNEKIMELGKQKEEKANKSIEMDDRPHPTENTPLLIRPS